MDIKQLYEEFVENQRFLCHSERTLEWYHTNLSDFIATMSVSTTDDLTLDNYKHYAIELTTRQKRNGEKLSSISVNSAIRAVKAFYNYAIGEDYIIDIARKLKLPKLRKKEKFILEDWEINKLIGVFKSDKLGLRDKCIACLMLDSGLRRGEIPRILLSDLDRNNSIILVNGKGGKQRVVPYGETSASLIEDYILRCRSEASEHEPLFVDRFGNDLTDNAIKLVFQKLKQHTGIERLHPHLLRHTFATNYLIDGGDIETLRLLLGHTDITTTEIYLHYAMNQKIIKSKHNSHIDKMNK